jgi:ribosomal protein S18 acetylase RimI-like enzyme
LKIRIIEENDLDKVALVHAAAFPRQGHSKEWLLCTTRAFPRMLCYMVEQGSQVLGYIIWAQKSGFRPEAVIELEQIAIYPDQQNKGIGQLLIRQSLQQVKTQLLITGSSVKHVLVSTRADNHAQKLYRKVLGAEVEATISNLFSADEVYMVARDV